VRAERLGFKVEGLRKPVWTGTFEISGNLKDVAPAAGGGLDFNQSAEQYCYLTHAPAKLSEAPDLSFPIPDGEVSIDVDVAIKGPTVSLWIMEFHGEQRIAKHSWRVDGRKRQVKWSPNPSCDSARIALRVSGSGHVGQPNLSIVESSKAEKDAMQIWRLLNLPKAGIDLSITDVTTAHLETAKGIGPAPILVALPRDSADSDAARTTLAEHGLDESAIALDGPVTDRAVFPHLKSAMADRAYAWRCPFSGAPVSSQDTFLVSEPSGRPYTMVRFESAGHVYYLILCPFRGSRIGAYFPETELVVSRLKLGKLVRVFRALAVRNAAAMRRYLVTDRPRQLTVPLNTMSHWGHVVLNEFEALQWAFDSGAADHVDIWLKGEVGFVEIERLFPEIPRERLRNAVSPEAQFRFCLDESALIVRPQIAFMLLGEKVAHRFVDHCRAEGERLGITPDIDARLAGHFPVIWCELRANDRLWLNQLEGLVAMVNRLKPEFPDLAIVLAGWSRMLAPNAGDEKMIAREEEVAAALARALEGTPCIPVSGVATKEKMLWALACDLHVSIFGSGMLFALLAALPGVTLVSRYYQENEIFLGDPERQVHFMHGDDRLTVLPPHHVSDDMDQANGEVRGFSVDSEALAELVREQVILLSDRTT